MDMYKVPSFENTSNYYDIDKKFPLCSWNYLDNTTIDLTIPSCENYEDIEVNFYDYKSCNLVQNISCIPQENLQLDITMEMSKNFKPGLYYLEVIGINETEQIRKTIYSKIDNYVEVL